MHILGRLVYFGWLVVLLLAGCGKPESPTEAAERLFLELRSGGAQKAYDSAAFAFQARQPFKLFETNIRELGLTDAKGAKVSLEENSGREAKVDAEVTGPNGEKLALKVKLQQEGGKWKLFALNSSRDPSTGFNQNRFSVVGKGAAFHDPVSLPKPDDYVARLLVEESMTLFADGVTQKSFRELYRNISEKWQEQVSPAQLQRAFQGFIDAGVDVAQIVSLQPVLDQAPTLTSEGLLVLVGHYPSQPARLAFKLSFIHEQPNWKLFAMEITLGE